MQHDPPDPILAPKKNTTVRKRNSMRRTREGGKGTTYMGPWPLPSILPVLQIPGHSQQMRGLNSCHWQAPQMRHQASHSHLALVFGPAAKAWADSWTGCQSFGATCFTCLAAQSIFSTCLSSKSRNLNFEFNFRYFSENSEKLEVGFNFLVSFFLAE
jgi:hypothetical protein